MHRSSRGTLLCAAALLIGLGCGPTDPARTPDQTSGAMDTLTEVPTDLAHVQDVEPTQEPAPVQTAPAIRASDPAPGVEVAASEAVPSIPTEATKPSTDPPLCTADVPGTPAPGATGVVHYQLVGPWAQYAYGALYVLDASGSTALLSGKPSVRNGDSFAFAIDDSMRDTSGTWRITTMVADSIVEPCEVRLSDLDTVTAPTNTSAGY